MRDKMARFMMGRYGNDPLNQVLMVLALVFMFASSLWQPLYSFALVIMVFSLFRMFSRNVEKRRAEFMAFDKVKSRIVSFFKTIKNMAVGTKTHRYFRCPKCKQQLRAPRGKGRINIHCQKCQTDFQRKT